MLLFVYLAFFTNVADSQITLSPIAPAAPNFSNDFSKEIEKENLPAIDGKELEDLRENDFKEELKKIVPATKFANQKIGRDPPTSMVMKIMETTDRVEDISEFALASSELDEQELGVREAENSLPGSSKFDELPILDSDVTLATTVTPITPTTITTPSASPIITVSTTIPTNITPTVSTTIRQKMLSSTTFTPTTTKSTKGRTKFETHFHIKKRNEGVTEQLREQIRSTSQLLNLLGDRITGIDQEMIMSGPDTVIHPSVYHRGELRRPLTPLRHHKQWGRTSANRVGHQHVLDGNFGAPEKQKQKSVGYTVRRRFRVIPGAKRHVFLQTGNPIKGRGSRAIDERRKPIAEERLRKNFAQALLETEETSMRALKKTLEQIRKVVWEKPEDLEKTPPEASAFNGNFNVFRL